MLINILVRTEDSVPELTNLGKIETHFSIYHQTLCVYVCLHHKTGVGVGRGQKPKV